MRSFRHKLSADYETKPKRALAARLTKRNIKAVAKAISERLDTDPLTVNITDCSVSWKTTNYQDKVYEIKLGQYLVMNVGFEILTKQEFEDKYREVHHLPSYYIPTDNEVKVMRALASDEYYYGYGYICDETDLTHEGAKAAIDNLRSLGVVYFARGLMNEDGEVCGSGFALSDEIRAEALLYRYHRYKGEVPE